MKAAKAGSTARMYSPEERRDRIGWGHSSSIEAARFAQLVGASRLACFHHDPAHDDPTIDRIVEETARVADGVDVFGAREGQTITL